ncbi:MULTISPECIES: HEAT repeat domain-containing protein [Halorubrum]|uniref:Phycocyanobilin lyase subunit n=1 Tax=Halorubrum hochstenium ATCC 700873 TaxID=1227481 RepID=M0F595_9EURY|nr:MULTISPECIES: HEAT repeat domain-containing protein [Halorubrum]ELZ54412.1 phycocyanobilin lyase subunit [Halorubrum hochstenium ATCC 700873]
MDDGPRTDEAPEPTESGDAGRHRGDRSAHADAGRTDGGRPPAMARLDRRFDASTRREAAEALGNPSSSMSAERDRIVEALFGTALDDPDEAVRAAAIESLYFHGDAHVDRLARRIAERRRGEGAEGAGEPEESAAGTFARWLDRDRAAYRMVGATGLGFVGGEDAAPRLREAFDDGDDRVRARAVRGYARVGGENVEAVRPLVNAPNDLVRSAAVDALVEMDTDEAVELLALAARRGNERLRLTVVERLGDLDRRDATGALLGSLGDPSEAVRRAAAASVAAVVAEADAVPAGDVRDRLLTERPFEADGLLAAFRAVAGERTAADRTGGRRSPSSGTGARDTDVRRYAAWLYCELLEAADPGAADRSAAVEWLIDALDHRDRLVADLAAAYLPRIVSEGETGGISEDATEGVSEDATEGISDAADPPDEPAEPPLGVDVERELRALASDGTASEAARERARAVLRRFKRAVVEAAADRHVEYVYVRWPADYTESYDG